MKVNIELHAPASLFPEEELPVLIGWAPEPVWTLWRREEFLSRSGIELPPRRLVTALEALNLLSLY
jgi:hypothetical protein